MGCGFSDQNWQEEMENAEMAVLQAVDGLNFDLLTLKYTNIEVAGETLAIRTYIYNDDSSKKTLVMTHGYAMAAVFFAPLLPELGKKYRVLMFDNLGMGMNSRTENVGDALESPEKAEQWVNTWWDKLIDALPLPPKFYLSGHSAGGAMAMMYISRHPERVEGLFLQSPAAAEDQSVPGWTYNPYDVRKQCATDALPSRREVDKMQKAFTEGEHVFKGLLCMPFCLVKKMVGPSIREMLKNKVHSDAFKQACVHYWALTTRRLGKQDCVLGKMILFIGNLRNHLFTADKMLQDFDFPIAFCFGTRDFFGSEGADRIIKGNKHFKSGRSQIFKQHNSGHNVFLDDPSQLTTFMIGFFDGTITGTFELKPRKEFVPDTE